MKNKRAKAIAEGAVCTALSVLLMVIGAYVPFLSILTGLIAGAPMIYLGICHGTRISSVAVLASFLVMFILTGNVLSAALGCVMNLLPGLVIGYAISRRLNYITIVLSAAGAVLFGLMIELLLFNATAGGQGIANLIRESIDQAGAIMKPFFEGLAKQGSDQMPDLVGLWDTVLNQVEQTIFLYIPAFVIGASVAWAYAVIAMGLYLLRRVRAVIVTYRPFWLLHAPKSMCYAAMIMMLVANLSHDSTLATAALKNVVALLYAYFAVCGLSLIDFKLRSKLHAGGMRSLVYLAVFFVGYLLISALIQGLSILGIIDGLFNFRQLHKAGEDRVGHE